MLSLLTNTAALSSLRSLSDTQRQLAQTQAQVSTGLAVADAKDNPAYWSIATSMRAQIAGLGAADDGFSLTTDVLNVATAGLNAVRSDLEGIKKDLVLARQPGVSRSVIQDDISARQAAIGREAQGASFDGVNLLVDHFTEVSLPGGGDAISDQYGNAGVFPTTTATNTGLTFAVPAGTDGQYATLNGFNVVSRYSYGSFSDIETAGRNYGGDDDLGILTYGSIDTPDPVSYTRLGNPAAPYQRTSVLDFVIDGRVSPDVQGGYAPVPATDEDLDDIEAGVEQALSSLTTVGSRLGAETTLVANLQAYDASRTDALESGVGSLVDSDMSLASTRLQALQTRQQLGIQSLQIANEQGQLILKLFGTS